MDILLFATGRDVVRRGELGRLAAACGLSEHTRIRESAGGPLILRVAETAGDIIRFHSPLPIALSDREEPSGRLTFDNLVATWAGSTAPRHSDLELPRGLGSRAAATLAIDLLDGAFARDAEQTMQFLNAWVDGRRGQRYEAYIGRDVLAASLPILFPSSGLRDQWIRVFEWQRDCGKKKLVGLSGDQVSACLRTEGPRLVVRFSPPASLVHEAVSFLPKNEDARQPAAIAWALVATALYAQRPNKRGSTP